ncbi:MAG: AAA family ATPase [Acidobacteriia bacterium]|nr:AAA family ATPase [Terriglobia bacterium]
MEPATTLREAFQATNPQQSLASGDPYYVDLTQARGSRATDYLRQMIENCDVGQYSPIVFSGHRGSGKSTELRQLEQTLKTSCFMLYLDISDFLDPLDVHYTDLFLLACRQLLETLHRSNVALRKGLIDEVEKWFMDVTKETKESVELSAGVSTEAKAGAEIPFIARLLAKLTADAKAGSSHVTTTRQELERQFSGLSSSTNVLLTAASQALRDANNPYQLLIVFDNLDRLPSKKSEELFFAHGSQLQEMACHAVYTVSIDTYYSRRHLANVFPNRQIIPNVKLRASKSSSEPNRPGTDALLQVIQKRLNVGVLLQPPALAEEFVRRSGGSIRQLIRLLREAVQSAQARGLATIDSEALEDAARSIQQDYERMLEPSDYKLLARTWATKSIEKDDAYMQLLSNLAILEYNGVDLWYDVNPLIESADAFQAVVKKTRPKRRRR